MTGPDAPSLPPRPRGKRHRSGGVSAWTVEGGSGRIAQPVSTCPKRAYSSPPAKTSRRPTLHWVLVAIVAATLLAFLIYHLIDATSRRADVGETLIEGSGLEFNVSRPQAYNTGGVPPAAAEETLYHVVVAVNNPTDKVMSSSDLIMTASVGGTAVEPVYSAGGLTEQLIEPNVQLNVPFIFKVKGGTTGQLQISVRWGNREPVHFSGTELSS